MSNDLNQCNFIGRVGRDVELRYLSNGDPAANFSIACNWKTKDKEGTEWVNVTVFGKLAELVSKYTNKGSLVFVSGRMRTDKYQKDGVEKYSVKIVADKVQFLSKSDSAASTTKETNPENPFDGMKDDLPF